MKKNIYEKITTTAKDLVSTGKSIEAQYGIPIVNKRISVTPIALVGGPACKTLDDYLQMTRDAMDCGVGGVTMGRFVWDYKDVTALVIALRYMIHEGYSVKEAKELLAQLENDKNYDQF